MAATPENAARNMRTLSANVRARLQLSDDDNGWTFDQRAAYLRAVAAEVLRLPDSFTVAQVQSAQKIAGTNYGPLADPSFNFSEFADLTATNAAPALSQARWLVWGVVAVLALWFLGPFLFATMKARRE